MAARGFIVCAHCLPTHYLPSLMSIILCRMPNGTVASIRTHTDGDTYQPIPINARSLAIMHAAVRILAPDKHGNTARQYKRT